MKDLTPEVSPRHLLGAELRRLRLSAGLSQRALAELVYVSGDLIRKVECAQRFPSTYLVDALDRLLVSDGRLAALRAEAVAAAPPAPRHPTGCRSGHARLAGLLAGYRPRRRPGRRPTVAAWGWRCPSREPVATDVSPARSGETPPVPVAGGRVAGSSMSPGRVWPGLVRAGSDASGSVWAWTRGRACARRRSSGGLPPGRHGGGGRGPPAAARAGGGTGGTGGRGYAVRPRWRATCALAGLRTDRGWGWCGI